MSSNMSINIDNTKAAEILETAADVIKERGGCRHYSHDLTTGRVCINGALAFSLQQHGFDVKWQSVPPVPNASSAEARRQSEYCIEIEGQSVSRSPDIMRGVFPDIQRELLSAINSTHPPPSEKWAAVYVFNDHSFSGGDELTDGRDAARIDVLMGAAKAFRNRG